jgi:hypothetical protein
VANARLNATGHILAIDLPLTDIGGSYHDVDMEGSEGKRLVTTHLMGSAVGGTIIPIDALALLALGTVVSLAALALGITVRAQKRVQH